MSGERERLFEEALLSEGLPAEREALNRLLAADPEARAAWVAHRRLAVRLRALAPNPDLGVRVLAVARAGRRSQRRRIADGVRGRLTRRRRTRWAVAGTLAAVAVLIALVVPGPGAIAELQRADGNRAPIVADTTLAADAPMRVRWRDGSVATLAPGTRAAVRSDGLRLMEGMAEFVVAPRSTAPFRVVAPHAAVEVLGTRFRCTVDAAACAVTVDAGRVRFAAAGSALRLEAGESARADAGSPPRRERIIWRWPGGDARVALGSAEDGVVTSGIYRDASSACPAVRIQAAPGSALFRWRPGLTLRVAIRADTPSIKLQCYAPDLQANQVAEAPVSVGAWTIASYRLDDLRPYGSRPRVEPGSEFDRVDLLPSADDAQAPFAVGWIEVTAEGDADP